MAYDATQVTLDAQAVTPSDSTAVSYFGLYVGGYKTGTTPGNVTIVTAAGTTTTFTSVPPGTTLRVAISKVKSTGTDATLMVGFGPT